MSRRGEKLVVLERLQLVTAKDIVERDREAGHHEDVRQHRERHHIFQIAHLTEQYQCRDQREDTQLYVYVPVDVGNCDLKRKQDTRR